MSKDREPEQKKITKILPCPLCGSNRVACLPDDPSDMYSKMAVICHDCKVSTRTEAGREPAITSWNRRAFNNFSGSQIEALAKGLYSHSRAYYHGENGACFPYECLTGEEKTRWRDEARKRNAYRGNDDE